MQLNDEAAFELPEEEPKTSIMGRPRKISEERLLAIMELRTQDLLTWKELAEWYEEQFGEPIDGTTIKRAILRDAPINLVPAQVDAQVKVAIEKVKETLDLLRMIMFMIQARFTEWIDIHNTMIRVKIANAVLEEGEEEVVFKEQVRMDFLHDNITAFFLRYHETMKQLQPLISSNTSGLMVWGGGGNVALPEGSVGAEEQSIDALVKSMAEKTQGMMEVISASHQLTGRGEFREVEVEEADFEVIE